MTLIVNWRGSDELHDGSAKAPTDTGAESGDPAALDADGREHLELKELALNYSVEDACFWLRRSDNSLAKFRPGAVVLVVDQESALPASGSAAAKRLRNGDMALVRFAADGHTPLNRLVVWDASHGTGGGWLVPMPLLTELQDVDHTASPALGTMPIWTYPAGHTSVDGKFYFNSPNAHLKNWDSTVHWESGATVFHNGELWRATQENSNVEPVIEAGKAMLFIHIAGEPSFALVPTGISSTPPPAGTQPMGAMRYAYWLVYKSDQDMDVWKFKITGKNPTTGKLEGVWEEKTWPCVSWRHPIPPPTKIDALSVWVWIYDQPGGTVQPVIGQQKWAQIHLSINVGQANDVEAMQPKGGDILVFDANKKKWVATSKADFLAMP